MITKRQFAELVITELSGGDIIMRNKYDERDVFRMADMAIADMIAAEYASKRGAADAYINGNYIKAFENVEVKWNENRNKSYFELPAEMIALENDKGLRMVSFMDGEDQMFKIIANGSLQTWNTLQVSSSDGSFSVFVEGSNVFIPDMPKNYACKLLVKMICSTSDLDPDELLRIPAQAELTLYERVLKLFGIQQQSRQKMGNDSNPNTP